MRKLNVIGALGLALCLGTSPAIAEPHSYHISAKELLSYCQDTLAMMNHKQYNVSKSSWCIGFIQGSVTSHRFYSTFYAVQDPQNKGLADNELGKKVEANQVFCVPSSVTLGVIVKDVDSFIEQNPQYQGEQASMVVARALNKKYSCR